MTLPRHRTARERAAHTAAAAAITRATARTRPQPDDDDHEPYYPVTPAVARTIRLEIEEDRRV